MGFLNIFKLSKTIQEEYKPAKKSILPKIRREEHYVLRNTLRDIDYAITDAQGIDYPNRHRLLELYFDIVKDPHLKNLLNTRTRRIKGLNFTITKPNDSKDQKAVTFFKQEWFKRFLTYALDASFYGNSLIEILSKKGSISMNLIPRENVIPEFTQIKYDPNAINGDVDYSAPIYAKSIVNINNNNDNRDLGELLSVVKNIIIKNEVLLNWSQYIEIFGQPIRVATTDTEVPEEYALIEKMMIDQARSTWIVKNSQTDIDFEESSAKGASNDLFQQFETYMDEQVSKAIVGGTMITDDGSSRSQSEVHERGLGLITKSDISIITDIINYQLIPILKAKGFIPKSNVIFSFEEPEIQTVEEKVKIDEFLLMNFNVKDIEYFENRYGTKLKYKTNGEEESEDNGSETDKTRPEESSK